MAHTYPIRTVFYRGNEAVKTNHAMWANNAVPNAVRHMQINQYDATHCEVYDSVSGELHAVIKAHIGSNRIEILFKCDVREGM